MPDDLLAALDRSPLNRRYWLVFALMAAVFTFDFFDFVVVGYLLAAVAPEWHLTYGQSAAILYSGGIGAIAGAVLSGSFADAWGRKMQIVAGTLVCAISSGLIALVPNDEWIIFAALRFFVGVGLSAAVTPSITMIVELTPTPYRTIATSFYLVFLSVGGMLAPIVSAAIMGSAGWRGVASLGFLAAILAALVWIYVPESARWLMAKGKLLEARAEVARHLGVPVEQVPVPTATPAAPPRGNFMDLLADPRAFVETILIWGGSSTAMYGIFLWGPTIVALLLKISVAAAATFFIFVSGAGVLGKAVATLLAPALGRRRVGIIWGLGGFVTLAVAGYENTAFIAEIPVLIIILCFANFCIEGGFANLAPYTVERYGVSLGARASGLGQAANGIGKILGPLSLSFIAGTSNLVSSQQTAAAVRPTFLFLSACMIPVGLSFLLFGVETHGKAIQIATRSDP